MEIMNQFLRTVKFERPVSAQKTAFYDWVYIEFSK